MTSGQHCILVILHSYSADYSSGIETFLYSKSSNIDTHTFVSKYMTDVSIILVIQDLKEQYMN